MDVKIAVILLCCLFRQTPALPDTSAEAEHDALRAGGHEPDIENFMSKMYSMMPQGNSTVIKEMDGPNAGYVPYWHGYNFQKGDLKQQAPQYGEAKDWDYGLSGANGKNIWAPNEMKIRIGGRDGILGAGAHLNDDEVEATDPPRPPGAPLNWGPTGKLGVSVWSYDNATLDRMWNMTQECLHQPCSQEDIDTGIVCAVDKKGHFFEIDRCVLKKNNCFKGIAYIGGRWMDEDFSELIAVQDEFVRVSIRGREESHMWMQEAFHEEDTETAGFRIHVNSKDRGGRHSGITLGQKEVAASWPWYDKYWDATREDTWKEYTMVWNTSTGWFLMSMPRVKDYKTEMYLEYIHYRPLDLRYIAVSGQGGLYMEYILHDLPTDLEELYTGPCAVESESVDEYEDTYEVIRRADNIEKEYQKRMKNAGYGNLQSGPKWQVEGGSDGEY